MRSFRAKLTLWNTAVLLVVLLSFGATTALLTERAVVGGVDREMEQFLRRGRGPGAPPEGGSVPRAPAPPFALPRAGDPNGPRAIAPDGSGDSLSTAGFVAAAQGGFDARTETIDGRPVRVASLRQELPDGGWQVVQVGRDLSDAEATLAEQRTVLLLMLPAAVMVAAVGGAFLVRRALRPVDEVTQAAAKIGAEDLSLRLGVEGDDELANLARTFNGMIARLEGSFGTLERAYEEQKRFVADASHELRTPLSRIKLISSSQLTQHSNEEERTEALRTIDRTADEMARLVDGLLQLARADAGALQLRTERVVLADVVRETVAACSASPPVSVETDASCVAKGDADAVRRILTNLLSNAQRHAAPEGRVRVGCALADETVSLSVSDDGEGIAPEHLSRVKDRFYRADPGRARREGGTGLGLAICDSLALAMGGALRIESAVGKGTVATLTLPRARE